ncbi:MAG: hypothetical protein GF421_06450 [Candidatus Aminicenantes bacterium]|nr:hypothetical protein [Candidatus Aminicenantes bacterium]
MRLNRLLKRHFKTFSMIGIASSWLTIALVWGGFAVLPLVGFIITGGFFGLAFAGIAL